MNIFPDFQPDPYHPDDPLFAFLADAWAVLEVQDYRVCEARFSTADHRALLQNKTFLDPEFGGKVSLWGANIVVDPGLPDGTVLLHGELGPNGETARLRASWVRAQE